MTDFVAQAEAVQAWIRALASAGSVFFPQKVGRSNYRFEPVDASATVQLEGYRPSLAPPGKKLSPARDELLRFVKRDGAFSVAPTLDRSQRVLAGVRPCDLRAIHLMDRVQLEWHADPHYLSRRAQTDIIAAACLEPCDDRCFCAAVGSLDHREGADVFLTPEDGQILVEALTPRGEALLRDAGFAACPDLPARRALLLERRPRPFGRQLGMGLDQLPARLREGWRSPAWQRHSERCFSCGSCNMVCPTCYCFDVRDEVELDLASGARCRTWDSCMLPQFAEVAGGHNFRPDPAGRQRHRMKRKFEYLLERHGQGSFCVGCGRCGRQCTSGIDIFDIVNDVAAGG